MDMARIQSDERERSGGSLGVTEGGRGEGLSRYIPEKSRPGQDEWVFEYTVRITNQRPDTVQLLRRHWIITDALDHVKEVEGPGVIGETPVLGPGDSFTYTSFSVIATPAGVMHGT